MGFLDDVGGAIGNLEGFAETTLNTAGNVATSLAKLKAATNSLNSSSLQIGKSITLTAPSGTMAQKSSSGTMVLLVVVGLVGYLYLRRA